MSVIDLETYVFCQKLYGAAKLEHKMFLLEYASHNHYPIMEVFKECKRMFPGLPETVYCIPQFVNLKINRHFIIDNGNRSVSSLVNQKSYFSKNNKIMMMVYFFTVPSRTSITLSEFCVEFYVKVHIYNQNDQKYSVNEKKHFAFGSSFQTTMREKTKLFIQLTVNDLGQYNESSQREKAFYFTVKSNSLPLTYPVELELSVQQFFEGHRKDSPDPNKVITLVQAFNIKKITQTGEFSVATT